jgi:hypothetical protein
VFNLKTVTYVTNRHNIITKDTSSILNILYPKVEKSLGKNINKFKQCVSNFINDRNAVLFDTCPCDRIYYGEDDAAKMFEALDISRAEVAEAIYGTYYYPIASFNPRAAKDEITILLLTVIRYFFKKKDQQNTDLAMIYLSFSGKMYPSIHSGSYPKVQPSEYRYVMEYVLNKMLSNKFDLITKGSVFGAIKSIGSTWLVTYSRIFNNYSDEDVVYLVQQLHNRIKSFTKNIATLYYQAYDNKDYMTYDSDSLDDSNYHLADSDSLKAERFIERSMEKINTGSVDYKLCKMASDNNVKTEEIKSIIESILNDRQNVLDVKELIRILVYTYFEQAKTKEVSDISFITFCVSPKPNTKDQNIIRMKAILENWLDSASVSYRKRKKRLATKNSYNRALLMYFTLVIHIANK